MLCLVMRMKILHYLVCGLVIAGISACNQQSQNNVAPEVKPEVKPVPPAAPAKPKKPVEKVKPTSPAKPAKPEKKEAPAQPVTPEQPVTPPGQAEVTAAPGLQQSSKPVRLKPLGKRVSQVPMKGMYVALTFDDGPHPSLTAKALDILKRHGAKGTFFILGQNAARYKSVVARAAAEGHELGVHTWSHIKMNSSSRARVDSEVSRTQNTLASISGTVPRVMRPPYGATNKTLVNHMYNRYGMASILWDVDTLDWRKPGVSKVINTAVNKARPGSIILVHDIHASTIDALEGIVTGLQARGFKLVTVSELMRLGKQEAKAAAQPVTPEPAPAVEPAPAEQQVPASAEPAGDPVPVQDPVQPSVDPAPAVEPLPALPAALQQPGVPAAGNAEMPLNLESLDLGTL